MALSLRCLSSEAHLLLIIHPARLMSLAPLPKSISNLSLSLCGEWWFASIAGSYRAAGATDTNPHFARITTEVPFGISVHYS